MTYLVLVAGSLSFWELSLGRLRIFIQAAAGAGMAIMFANVAVFLFTGSNGSLMLLANVLGASVLVILTAVVAVPGLSRKYLVLSDRRVLAAGILVFAI
jgi:hypothetical protein